MFIDRFLRLRYALHDAYVVARTDARLFRYLYPMIRKALNYLNQKAPRGTQESLMNCRTWRQRRGRTSLKQANIALVK